MLGTKGSFCKEKTPFCEFFLFSGPYLGSLCPSWFSYQSLPLEALLHRRIHNLLTRPFTAKERNNRLGRHIRHVVA
jgi:hypothetical protein